MLACNLPCHDSSLVPVQYCSLKQVLRAMSHISLRVSADPWALEGPFGLVKRPQTMKHQEILIMDETLTQPNLSHMDFLDDPAAIH